MKKPRVVLADDHRIVIDGLQKILESAFDVVGTAPDGRQLLVIAPKLHPDIIVLDICMPLLNGIEAAPQLIKSVPAVKLVFLTEYSTREYVVEAFRAGASAYVLKTSPAAELVAALQAVLHGFVYITPPVARDVVGSLLAHSKDSEHMPFARTLTRRQREVLQLVAEGRSTKEVATILEVSPRTVEYHRACIGKALGIHTTAEVTKYAMAQGLTTA